MSDNIIQKILDATDGGLQIILSLYPDAQKCVDNNRHFKLRDSEKTASATLTRNKINGNYYVKDFGGDFKGNAVSLFVYKEGCDLKTAIKHLGAQYQVFENAAPPEDLKPKYEIFKADPTEEEGAYSFEYKDVLNDFEIETIFAKHTIDYAFNVHKDNWKTYLNKVCAGLSFFALVSFTYIKNGERRVTSSTDKYPIFVLRGEGFEKVYQPKSLDKKYRFRYFGKKPLEYTFGYTRLCKTFADGEAKWLADQQDPESDIKPGKPFQLTEVINCSGDRDAINVAALGYNVIWQNSESSLINKTLYAELKKKCVNVCNLPDLDVTGQNQGHALALTYLDLKTINLPLELLEKKDWRGNPCKDVHDYLKYYPAKKFEECYKNALEYKFWDEEPQFDKNGKFKKNVYVFNNVRAYNFLQRSGFGRIKSKTARNGEEFVQIEKNVVRVIETSDVKAYINNFLEQRYFSDQLLRNTFYRSPQLKEESLSNLKFVDPDFKYFDADFQYFFFRNATWKVTKDEIFEYRPGDVNKFVWEEKVVDKRVKKLDPAFTIKEVVLPDGTKELDIDIHRNDCLFFNYLVNASRMHWRKELEEACEATYTTEEDRAKYRKENKFNIAGPLLTADEIKEQKKHLINKLWLIGHMLCRHKEKSKPWSPFLMDHKLSAEGESHGGSGKTIMARSVETFTEFLLMDGKSKSLQDDKHAFENVTEKTEIVLIDDLSRYVSMENYFSMQTEDFTVNPKYNQRFVIPYKDSPRILFTSNYGVRDISPSAERRLVYSSFSDYYHNNLTGNYREDRTPANDFGKDLITHFDDNEWVLFINTMVRCLQTYMGIPHKVNPPMDNVSRRNLQGIMGDAFLNWADVYFSDQSGRLNEMVPRSEALNDFIKQHNIKQFSTQRFSSCLEAWCKYYNYEFNPQILKNTSGRIIKKAHKKRPDGQIEKTMEKQIDGTYREVMKKHPTEMVYIKTTEGKLDPAALLHDDENHIGEIRHEGISQANIKDEDLP